MPGNTIGTIFRVTTAGESHGKANVVIIDGVPAGLVISEEEIQHKLDRRRPGRSKITTSRKESDKAEILSGIFQGKTLGTPIAIEIRNEDQRSSDYADIKHKYRPGHADYSYDSKYGIRDYRGGGRASARETVSRVAAGAIAQKLLATQNIKILAYTRQVGNIKADITDPENVKAEEIETNDIRCPDAKSAREMYDLIEKVKTEGDSIGGIAEIVVTGVPPGLGEPVFDKLKADLAKALFSIPAVTGIEFGIGFEAAQLKGSETNDVFTKNNDIIRTKTNKHGGILGGISSGMPVIIRCAVKAASSIAQKQKTIDDQGQKTKIEVKGRHDPCLLPRFIPVAEAMTAIVFADHQLRSRVSTIK